MTKIGKLKNHIPQVQLYTTFALILAYTAFMFWWFLRDDAPTSRQSGSRSASVAANSKPSSGKPVGNSSKSTPASERKVTAATVRPVIRGSSNSIQASELSAFKPYLYPGGTPYYDGEPVTAYVRVPSSRRQQALTVNQAGEFPRMQTEPGETVQIRLAFTETVPDTPIALTVHDGGAIEGRHQATALRLDAARQLGFSFTVSTNPGLHRVTVLTPKGETKTLEFWAGPPIPWKVAQP